MKNLNKKIDIYKKLVKYLLYEIECGNDRQQDLEEIEKRLKVLKKQKKESKYEGRSG